MFIVCLMSASVGGAVANPVKFIQIDTRVMMNILSLAHQRKMLFCNSGLAEMAVCLAKVMILLFRNGLGWQPKLNPRFIKINYR